MFLKKHKGETITVPSEEELKMKEMKALESTLDFLRSDDAAEKESSASSEDKEDLVEPKIDKEDIVETETENEDDVKETISIKEEVQKAIEKNAVEESIDREKYPVYKAIPDEIKRSGRFGRMPSSFKNKTVEASIGKSEQFPEVDKQKQEDIILPDDNQKPEDVILTDELQKKDEAITSEKEEIIAEVHEEIKVEEQEKQSDLVIEDNGTQDKEENKEKETSTPLPNPLKVPAKHIKKEIDFDYEVDDKDMFFDIDISITNNDFDLK